MKLQKVQHKPETENIHLKVKLLPYCYNRSVSRFAAFILKANIKYTEIKCNYPPVAGLYYKACTLYPVNK